MHCRRSRRRARAVVREGHRAQLARGVDDGEEGGRRQRGARAAVAAERVGGDRFLDAIAEGRQRHRAVAHERRLTRRLRRRRRRRLALLTRALAAALGRAVAVAVAVAIAVVVAGVVIAVRRHRRRGRRRRGRRRRRVGGVGPRGILRVSDLGGELAAEEAPLVVEDALRSPHRCSEPLTRATYAAARSPAASGSHAPPPAPPLAPPLAPPPPTTRIESLRMARRRPMRRDWRKWTRSACAYAPSATSLRCARSRATNGEPSSCSGALTCSSRLSCSRCAAACSSPKSCANCAARARASAAPPSAARPPHCTRPT